MKPRTLHTPLTKDLEANLTAQGALLPNTKLPKYSCKGPACDQRQKKQDYSCRVTSGVAVKLTKHALDLVDES